MNLFKPLCLLLLSALLLAGLLAPGSVRAGQRPRVVVAPPAAWVEAVTADHRLPAGDLPASGGESFLLVDEQVQAAGPVERFYHYAIALTTQEGVENNSTLTITFDPGHQQLVWHEIRLWRDGRPVNQLAAERIQLLQRETRLEELIFDGRWTASCILEDVRPGDILEYSYSLQGDNPAYDGHLDESCDLQWSVPVRHSHFRLLWPRRRPLTVTPVNTTLTIAPVPRGELDEYRLEQHDVPALLTENEAPSWYFPWGRINFSDMADWGAVADWARPKYALAKPVTPEFAKVVKAIRSGNDTPAKQVAAALHFVQGEVRYLGIEMGAGSYEPAPPELTLQRRYGDCKAKCALLLALLDALHVEAYPALVNTDFGPALDEDGPRFSAFDHVLTRVQVGEKHYWLDPTLGDQKGGLDRIYQPDYGLALVLRPGSDRLEAMQPDPSGSRRVVDEVIDLREGVGPDHPGTYRVITTYTGREAERFRDDFASNGRGPTEKAYLNFYSRYYEDIQQREPMQVADHPAENRIAVTETYTVPGIWSDDAKRKRWLVSFYANAFSRLLVEPKQRRRTAPFAVPYPADVTERLTVYLPEDWKLKDEQAKIDNRYFLYEHTVSYLAAERKLTLESRFRYRVRSVPGAEIGAFLAAIDQVSDALDYQIYYRYGTASGASGQAEVAGTDDDSLALWLVLAVAGLLLYAWGELWWDGRRDAAEEGRYYPVDSLKFFLLSVATGNLYQVYWFHRNWSYVKRRDAALLLPWGRALFCGLWYFPLLLSLQDEPGVGRFGAAKRTAFALLAAGYLAALVVSATDTLYACGALVLAPALALPLLEQVNRLASPVRLRGNSRWRPRHGIVGLLGAGLLFFQLATLVNLVPGDSVVTGAALWDKDRKFLQRAGVLDAGGKLLAFYSDATFSFHTDGNGLTDQGVFSYWRDAGDQRLNIEQCAYTDLAEIKPVFGQNGATTVVKIVRKDGSNFVLYVTSTAGADRQFVAQLKRLWKGDAAAGNIRKKGPGALPVASPAETQRQGRS